MKIYKITNTVNAKFYVGKTIRSLEKRFYYHKYAASKYEKKSHLHLSMNKYGHDKFIIEELCSCISEDELNEIQEHYIRTLKPQYNKAPGGKGGRNKGFRLEEQHKSRISNSMKGKKHSDDHIKNASFARSKIWNFIDPNGNEVTIRNLLEYCRLHDLNQSHMVSVASGRKGFISHKGYLKKS